MDAPEMIFARTTLSCGHKYEVPLDLLMAWAAELDAENQGAALASLVAWNDGHDCPTGPLVADLVAFAAEQAKVYGQRTVAADADGEMILMPSLAESLAIQWELDHEGDGPALRRYWWGAWAPLPEERRREVWAAVVQAMRLTLHDLAQGITAA